MTSFLAGLGYLLVTYFALSVWATFWRGPFRFVYNPFWGWVLTKLKHDAMTIGARAYTRTRELLEGFGPNGTEPPPDAPLAVIKFWKHEQRHNRQWRGRPFFAAVYIVSNRKLEADADRAELE